MPEFRGELDSVTPDAEAFTENLREAMARESMAREATVHPASARLVVASGDLTPKQADQMFADFNARLENELPLLR